MIYWELKLRPISKGKVTLTQGGFTKKFLKTVGMLDINDNIHPAATIPLGTDYNGPPFDEPW